MTVAHLSLDERAAKYSVKYATKIARHQLRLLYAEHGITKKMVAKRRAWRRPSDMKNILKDQEMRGNMKKEISKIQAEDGEIIMIDECLFNQKQVMKTAWMVAGSNVIPAVMWPYQKCVPVLAAISNKRGLLHFYSVKAQSNRRIMRASYQTCD